MPKKGRNPSVDDSYIRCEKCELPGVWLSVLMVSNHQERHIYCPTCEHYRKTERNLQ